MVLGWYWPSLRLGLYKDSLILWSWPPSMNIWLVLQFWYHQPGRFFDTTVDICALIRCFHLYIDLDVGIYFVVFHILDLWFHRPAIVVVVWVLRGGFISSFNMVLGCWGPSLGLRFTKILSSRDNTHKHQYLTGITILILVRYVVWYHHFILYIDPMLSPTFWFNVGLTLDTGAYSEVLHIQDLRICWPANTVIVWVSWRGLELSLCLVKCECHHTDQGGGGGHPARIRPFGCDHLTGERCSCCGHDGRNIEALLPTARPIQRV